MERDTRPLGEIRFAADLPANDGAGREAVEAQIRDLLHRVGVGIGQDIVDLGCTGLMRGFFNVASAGDSFSTPLTESQKRSLDTAIFIRQNMSGSICGLPCYVPRDRYCLVHDTIGGLQAEGNVDGPQAQRHSEALPLMSRELTEKERQRVGGINKQISEEARLAALAEYGAEDIDDAGATVDDAPAPSCPVPLPPFKCSEHQEPNWECRKCIAQAIVEGSAPLQKEVWVDDGHIGWEPLKAVEHGLAKLQKGECTAVELWVRVASWSKKVTRD